MKTTDEQLALLRRIAPKASEALLKMHHMAIAKTEEERMRFCYMQIPAKPEEDADLILGEIVRRLPDLLDDIDELRAARS